MAGSLTGYDDSDLLAAESKPWRGRLPGAVCGLLLEFRGWIANLATVRAATGHGSAPWEGGQTGNSRARAREGRRSPKV